MKRLCTFLLLAAVAPLAGQQSPLAGTWQLAFTAGMRIVDDVPTPLLATGTLTIEVQGDSLIGRLVTDPTPDRPARPPARLAARASGGEAVFVSQGKATMQTSHELEEITVVSTWKLRAAGDSLRGTVERVYSTGGLPPQSPTPVTGKRKG
jgi:hypothetical protein